METNMPRNSINTPLESTEKIEFFKSENKRVREYNLKLKMDLIKTNKKLQEILQIINK
jgi:hypothetical protein